MSITYADLESTTFPDAIDNFDRFTDPTADSLALINQYYEYFDAGNISSAVALLNANPALKQMIINADTLNKLRDGIISLERYYMSDIQTYLQNIVKNRGVYSSFVQYFKYDVVSYAGSGVSQFFMCINDAEIGILPTNTAYFVPLTLKGDKGDVGIGLSYEGEWNSATTYDVDKCVAYSGRLWASNVSNTNSEPSDSNADWAMVFEISKQIVLSATQPSGQSKGDFWYEII